jgi:hypothetical protein
MCNICESAKQFKNPRTALKYIAKETEDGIPECVDALIGDLLGEKLSKADKGADKDWELASRDSSDSRSERI